MKTINGRYNLEKHGIFDKQNIYTSTSPYLKGEINYALDGSLSVLIMFRESIESAKDILSYMGKYEVISDTELIHHISLCSQQKRNSSPELRTYRFEGSKLILSCLLDEGKKFEAVWEKVA